MLRKKISGKQKVSTKNTQSSKRAKSVKKGKGVDAYDPTEALFDEDRIARAIWECLKNGDSEGVMEVVQIHLEAVNKTQLAKNADVPKTTLYHSLRNKNPTIKTLAKLIHACL